VRLDLPVFQANLDPSVHVDPLDRKATLVNKDCPVRKEKLVLLDLSVQ
jgi:hypothetical protein